MIGADAEIGLPFWRFDALEQLPPADRVPTDTGNVDDFGVVRRLPLHRREMLQATRSPDKAARREQRVFMFIFALKICRVSTRRSPCFSYSTQPAISGLRSATARRGAKSMPCVVWPIRTRNGFSFVEYGFEGLDV